MVEPGRRASDLAQVPWLNGNTPWWARVFLLICFWLGPAAIIALFFMAMWAGWITSPVTDNRDRLVRIEGVLLQGIIDMKARIAMDDTRAEYLIRLQLQTCRNTAKDEQQRQRCEDYWRGK